MAIKSNAFIFQHIPPNYSFTEIYINWIALRIFQMDTDIRYINEMRFILDDNSVLSGLTFIFVCTSIHSAEPNQQENKKKLCPFFPFAFARPFIRLVMTFFPS